MDIYEVLREALKREIERHGLAGKKISIRCRALSATEAIGAPDHDDYPIIKGREVMVESVFEGARGQAFADEFEQADYHVDDLLTMELDSNRKRASFVSGLNAVYRHLNFCDSTVHCRDGEPLECACSLEDALGAANRVLLVGYQPRFFEKLASRYVLRAVDMDGDNIGSVKCGVTVEGPEKSEDAVAWCDVIFATGSTLVNGTIVDFLNRGKPVIFYGITVAAAAEILSLQRYCACGH